MSSLPPSDPYPPAVFEGDPDLEDVEKNKVFAVLAYFGLLFLVGLIVARESRFAKYHVNQGVVLYIAGIAFGAAMAVPMMILAFIPIVNLSLCCFIPLMVGVKIAMVVIGVVNAAQGKMKPLPIIGGFVLIK